MYHISSLLYLFHGVCVHVMMSSLCLSPKGQKRGIKGIVWISAVEKKWEKCKSKSVLLVSSQDSDAQFS